MSDGILGFNWYSSCQSGLRKRKSGIFSPDTEILLCRITSCRVPLYSPSMLLGSLVCLQCLKILIWHPEIQPCSFQSLRKSLALVPFTGNLFRYFTRNRWLETEDVTYCTTIRTIPMITRPPNMYNQKKWWWTEKKAWFSQNWHHVHERFAWMNYYYFFVSLLEIWGLSQWAGGTLVWIKHKKYAKFLWSSSG